MESYKSRVDYMVSDNTKVTYSFPFQYLKKKFVKVEVTNTDNTVATLTYGVDYTVTDLSITLTTVLEVGKTLTIYRETDTDSIVSWNDGSILLAADMSLSAVQMLHLQEEHEDYLKTHSIRTETTESNETVWDASYHRIHNVADPIDAQDAVTKNYMETVQGGFVAKNTTIQNDIKSRQTDIIARQTDITTKQSNVATMKTSVEASQADVTAKQADVATMKTSVEASQADVTAKQSNVATMKTSVEASQADVIAKQSNVASMKTSVEASQADVTTKQSDVATMKTSVEASQADVTAKQENVTTMESNVEALQSKFNIPTQIYPGTILPWGSDTIPYGYLLCDGSAISRTTYSELFAQIGTTFGSGDGSTTFNVPDLRNKTIVGKGTSFATLGKTGGETTHTLTEAELPKITPTGTISSEGDHTHFVYGSDDDNGTISGGDGFDTGGNSHFSKNNQYITSTAGEHIHTFTGAPFGSGNAHNNMPPYMVMNWIIKYTVVGKSNADALYLQRNTAYAVGEVILGATNLSRQYVLICTTTGTTGTSDITTWGAVNDTTTDGTAVFVTRPAYVVDWSNYYTKNEVNELLNDIAAILSPTGTYDRLNWNTVKTLVKAGTAEKAIPIGSQIIVNWTDKATSTAYSVPLDVVHYGQVTLKDGETVNGMFLQWHYATPFGVQFDNYEAFYYATAALEAGTYNVTLGSSWGTNAVSGKTYQFTLTQDLPVGGQLSGFEGLPDVAPANWKVKSWASSAATTATETVSVTEGSGGTNLGTLKFGGDGTLNCMQRVGYGYGRWSASAMRQWLNSTGAASAWWTPQHNWDRYPKELLTKQGFLTGFDDAFIAALTPVKVTTALNTLTDASVGTTEDTYDKIFLPSFQQEYITPQLADVEGESWKYWKRASGLTAYAPWYTNQSQYITYGIDNKISAQYVRLRSANRGNSCSMWSVSSSGYVGSDYGTTSVRCAPACVIC